MVARTRSATKKDPQDDELQAKEVSPLVYSTDDVRRNRTTEIKSTILFGLFLISAFLRIAPWLRHVKGAGTKRSWLDSSLVLLQWAQFCTICAHGIPLMRLKPRATDPKSIGQAAAKTGSLDQNRQQGCQLQVGRQCKDKDIVALEVFSDYHRRFCSINSPDIVHMMDRLPWSMRFGV